MKIVLADDHAMVRQAMGAMLSSMPEVSEVQQCGSVSEVRRALADGPAPAMVIVDLVMPGMEGPAGVAELASAAPHIPFVVVSGLDDPQTCRAVLAGGARGYICKSGSSDVFEAAVRLVMAGGTYVPPEVLTGGQAEAVHRAVTVQDAPHHRGTGPAVQLTPRQLEVLREMVKGASNKDIARALVLSPATVKAHVATILAVLGVQNRTEAVTRAAELRLL